MTSALLLPEAGEPTKKSNLKYAFTCAIVASMASIVLGYDIGVMSGASLYIKKDLEITDVQVEILVGILSIYSLIGSFAAGRTSDWIGRRFTVLLVAAFFFAGALVMGFAVNYRVLMLGRFTAGIGVGYAMVIAPLYTAEISPASARGFLTSFPEVFANLGILLGYVSNYAFARLPVHLGWRFMLGLGAAPSVVLALLVFSMPESPRWLVMKGRLTDARVVLEKIADTPEEAAERLADIKTAAGIPDDLDGDVVVVPKNKKKGGEEKQVWRELIVSPTPAVRRILLTALGIFFFQQATGSDSVVLYGPRVFESAGIAGDDKILAATCAMGVTKTLVILVAMLLLDRVGRRPLLLYSTGGRRRGRLASRPRHGPHRRGTEPGRENPVGGRPLRRVCPSLRGLLLHRPRACDGRVHLGDLPAAGARAGLRARGGLQPHGQRHGVHDLPLAVQRHHHRRHLLPLRRHRRDRVGVLLHLSPGDARMYARGDGRSVRHGRPGHGGTRCLPRERETHR